MGLYAWTTGGERPLLSPFFLVGAPLGTSASIGTFLIRRRSRLDRKERKLYAEMTRVKVSQRLHATRARAYNKVTGILQRGT
jgi:hypothetical protein